MDLLGQNWGRSCRKKVLHRWQLTWTISKGTVPIPGGKSLQQVEQNIGALGWRLTDEEVDRLDQASDRVLKTLGW